MRSRSLAGAHRWLDVAVHKASLVQRLQAVQHAVGKGCKLLWHGPAKVEQRWSQKLHGYPAVMTDAEVRCGCMLPVHEWVSRLSEAGH